jgi:hypothetical protein
MSPNPMMFSAEAGISDRDDAALNKKIPEKLTAHRMTASSNH